MKRLFACLFAVLLVACGGGGGGGYPVIANNPAPPKFDVAPTPPGECTAVVYGDSIMAGQGIKAYVESRRARWRIEDRSVPGTALITLAGTFYGETRPARFVVLENGVIDAWAGVPVPDVLAVYSAMIDTIKAEGRTPIVTGYAHQRLGTLDMISLMRRDEHDGALKTFMLSRNVAFADLGSVVWNAADPGELPDSVHPGAAYSARLAQRLLETLDRVAPECTP